MSDELFATIGAAPNRPESGGHSLQYRYPAARRLLVVALAGMMAAASPALATSPVQNLSAGSVVDAAQKLAPGEFIWAPQAAPLGPVLLIVNLTSQRAVLYRNGIPIGITTVSSGRDGFATPTGVFTILEKDKTHFSNIYDNAPMPFMQRLTWGGVALHGGTLPGYPASHGCVRLPHAFAKLLFNETTLGMTVMVVRRPALPPLAPTVSPLDAVPNSAAPPVAYRWSPERAPRGPLSIILSGSDKMARVIRNGREIGAAPVAFAVPITRAQIFVLQSVDQGRQRWIRVDLPGQAGDAPITIRAEDVGIGDAFRSLVLAEIRPGTTVIITPDSLRGSEAAVEDILESE